MTIGVETPGASETNIIEEELRAELLQTQEALKKEKEKFAESNRIIAHLNQVNGAIREQFEGLLADERQLREMQLDGVYLRLKARDEKITHLKRKLSGREKFSFRVRRRWQMFKYWFENNT